MIEFNDWFLKVISSKKSPPHSQGENLTSVENPPVEAENDPNNVQNSKEGQGPQKNHLEDHKYN